MKAVVTPYDLRFADGVYTMVVQLALLGDGESFYHTLYVPSTSFNPLLPNWKSKITTYVENWAEDEEVEIDQLMFLPDFSLLGL